MTIFELARNGARVVVEEHGGKITSLVLAGRQWLVQRISPASRPALGDSYIDHEMIGWDEMLPTITGSRFDDHGDAWSQPWHLVARSAYSIEQQVHGARLPYALRRRIQVTSRGDVIVNYALKSCGRHPIEVLWAAHPLFIFPAGSKVLLDPTPRTVAVVDRPEVPVLQHWHSGLATMSNVPVGTHSKWWTIPPFMPSEGLIRHPDGVSLRVAWRGAALRSVGVWYDNGAFGQQPMLALEPATGFYDDVTRAADVDEVLTLEPNAVATWDLSLSCGVPSKIRDADLTAADTSNIW